MPALAGVLKAQRGRVVAHLARSLGLEQLALAEDAVQGAAVRALETWPLNGVPDNPAGWLYRMARHQCIDALRREGRHDAWPEDDDAAAMSLVPVQPAPAGRFACELDDNELALLFAACHPALPVASQVALALRAMTGLELAQIAEGLLCSATALAQRLERARDLWAGLGIRPGMPALQAHTLAALARAFERLGENVETHRFLQRARAAALHPADARQLERHAGALPGFGPRPR